MKIWSCSRLDDKVFWQCQRKSKKKSGKDSPYNFAALPFQSSLEGTLLPSERNDQGLIRRQMQLFSSNITISIDGHKILIRKWNSFGGKCCEKIARKVRSKSGKIWQQIGKNWATNRNALKSSLMGNSRVCVTKDHENWADCVSQTPGTTLCKLCKYFKFWRIL